MNLTKQFVAKRDAYASQMGDLVVTDQAVSAGDMVSVWDHFVALGGRQIRVIYRCKDGKVRDIVGRQGVHNSAQDGKVGGNGHQMRSRANLTLSFHTSVHNGAAVNVGAGKGYRTLRAAGILAYRCEGVTFITNEGLASL
jgi:hypothetical protein